MSQAHNPWGADGGMPSSFAHAQYHDQDMRAAHGARQASPSAHSQSYGQEQRSSQRTESGASAGPHHGHEPLQPYHVPSGGAALPTTRSLIHPTHPGQMLNEAGFSLPYPTYLETRFMGEGHRQFESAPPQPEGQHRLASIDHTAMTQPVGSQYPSAVQMRPSAANFPSPMHPLAWPTPGMPPSPMTTTPQSDMAITSSHRSQGEQPRDMLSGRPANQGSRHLATTVKYKLCVRQHPVAARSCGFGERDRRVIDPPPIVQVLIDDPHMSEQERQVVLSKGWGVMHCTIWSEDGSRDCSSMQDDFRTNKRLMGTPVSSPFVGHDDKNENGCFYCFPDLSVRTPGAFRLHFSLAILDPSLKKNVPVVAGVMSDIFRVHNAKDFPGMQASTSLTRALKQQGCLISIKKGKEHTNIPRFLDSGDEDEEEDDGGGGARPAKKFRK